MTDDCVLLMCARVLIAWIRGFLVVLLLFSTSCYRDYGPSKRNQAGYRSVPYATPAVPVRQPAGGYAPRQPSYNPYYYGNANSRSYYNPYDFQYPYGSNPYSDYDQYYVPPTQYYNNEYDNGSASTFEDKN